VIDGEQDTVVYQISDYTNSLLYAQEMEEKGYHVEALVFKKGQPTTHNHDILVMEGC
jgi:hypothetical protein